MDAEIKTQGDKALRALLEYNKASKKKLLFPEQDASVFFVAKYKKIPLKKRRGGHRKFISLPHSDRNPENTSVCLILPDLDKSDEARKDADVDRQSRQWAELLEQKYGITSKDYAKIFTFTQLEREYSQHADKAKLANTYDVFMIDNKLLRRGFDFLGSNFRKPAKMPFPFHSSRDFSNRLREVYSLVNLPLDSLKDSVSVRFGHLNQDLAELSANLAEVVDRFLENCPGGPVNVRSCHVQTTSTEVSLPIFVDFGSANDVKLEKSRKRVYPEVFDECSTLPDGLAVKVSLDGRVTVVDKKTMKEVIYPTAQDEWEASDNLKPIPKKTVEQIVKNKVRIEAIKQKKRKSAEEKVKKEEEK